MYDNPFNCVQIHSHMRMLKRPKQSQKNTNTNEHFMKQSDKHKVQCQCIACSKWYRKLNDSILYAVALTLKWLHTITFDEQERQRERDRKLLFHPALRIWAASQKLKKDSEILLVKSAKRYSLIWRLRKVKRANEQERIR